MDCSVCHMDCAEVGWITSTDKRKDLCCLCYKSEHPAHPIEQFCRACLDRLLVRHDTEIKALEDKVSLLEKDLARHSHHNYGAPI